MTFRRAYDRFWPGFWACVVWVLFSAGCPADDPPVPDDGPMPDTIRDLGVPIVVANKFEDCTPDGAGFSDVVCASGLHCGIVVVGNAGFEGYKTQCIPDEASPLKEGDVCSPSVVATPATDPPRKYDRCGKGLGCVPSADGVLRCKRLCALRTHGKCGKSEMCVLPSPVSGIGFCNPPDACEPVFPQRGCGKAKDGSSLSCYVLGDDKNTGTVCWPRQPYGTSTGDLDAPCERSWHCQSGFACTTQSGKDLTCRPYCVLPEVPDGGSPPDGGTRVMCAAGLGECHPMSGYERVGRCY
ncbi:MAG TPA: hypothetical protein PKE31_15840 [Pseudomonadota bacterium]|nr:hypothetical protein [Pseudomonadota bacterium]